MKHRCKEEDSIKVSDWKSGQENKDWRENDKTWEEISQPWFTSFCLFLVLNSLRKLKLEIIENKFWVWFI